MPMLEQMLQRCGAQAGGGGCHRGGGGARVVYGGCASASRRPRAWPGRWRNPARMVSTLEGHGLEPGPHGGGTLSRDWTPGGIRSTTPRFRARGGALGAAHPRPGHRPGGAGRGDKKERASANSGWRRREFVLYYPQGTGIKGPSGAGASGECRMPGAWARGALELAPGRGAHRRGGTDPPITTASPRRSGERLARQNASGQEC